MRAWNCALDALIGEHLAPFVIHDLPQGGPWKCDSSSRPSVCKANLTGLCSHDWPICVLNLFTKDRNGNDGTFFSFFDCYTFFCFTVVNFNLFLPDIVHACCGNCCLAICCFHWNVCLATSFGIGRWATISKQQLCTFITGYYVGFGYP